MLVPFLPQYGGQGSGNLILAKVCGFPPAAPFLAQPLGLAKATYRRRGALARDRYCPRKNDDLSFWVLLLPPPLTDLFG